MELLPDLLVAADSITITTHLNPDGDGYCAALALQRIIAKLGKPSTIWMDNDSLERFDFLFDPAISLSESRAVVRTFSSEVPDQELSSDLLFILDCNSFNRVGARRALVDNAKRTVLLDHHILENHPIQADYSIIDPTYVSVGAIIFELFKELVSSLADPDRIFICNCLYSTILNDTNNYANANTNAAVFRFASELSELGIKANVLHKEFFLNHSAEEMRYVGQTLATIQLHLSRRILTMYSTLEMSRVNNIDPESVMNITRWVQGVSGTDAIIYFREEAESCYKLSLRSVHLDVNTIAVKYGGGGHRQASGCTMEGSLNDVMATILADFRIAILEYDQNR
jgi:phosphoesterase RecJ-like protein